MNAFILLDLWRSPQSLCLQGIPKDPRDRSPSPEPIYNSNGKRLNTRLDRTRNKLISQRNICVSRLKELDPTYQPPSAFKYRNAELEDKVMIPAEEHPEINFVGLILGPRGNSLEAIKKRHGTMVAIRGKGSLKDGMSGITKDGKIIDHLDEPMHAYITGPTAEAVKGTADEIRELIEMQVFRPDCEKVSDAVPISSLLNYVDFKSEFISGCGDPRETHARVGDPERHAAGHR